MEKVYWVSKSSELNEMNSEMARYGGHVTMITAVSTTKDQSYPAHAFIVVAYPKDSHPNP